MLKRKTVIWMTIILSLLSYVILEHGEKLSYLALAWVLPALVLFVWMLTLQDWKENEYMARTHKLGRRA